MTPPRIIIGAGFIIMLLGGCKPPYLQTKEAEKPGAILVITWFVQNQPPTTTQLQFSNISACREADVTAERAAFDLRNAIKTHNLEDANEVADSLRHITGLIASLSPGDQRKLTGTAIPTMAAYCVQQ